ncbi:hypothetical protein AB0K89_11435 [Streptomyces cinnamoneus]|uniref:hypothetical protein n=1 Tax=Streptomyces cinnamoneus TaxID=53446 RepID=UPI003444E334
MNSVFPIQADRLCRVRAGNDPVEDLLPLSDDGFLDDEVASRSVDGEPVPGALACPEVVAAFGATVLLGEPGGGKTTVLRRLVQGLRAVEPDDPETAHGYVWVNGSDLTEISYQDRVGRYLAALPRMLRGSGTDRATERSSTPLGGRTDIRLTVVLDQLDESGMVFQLPGSLARSLHGRDTSSLRMLLACRTADYPVRLTEVLRDHFTECTFADLAPLPRAEAVRLAQSGGVDGEALVAAAVAVGAGALASAPLTLDLLVRIYREEGGLRGDPRDLFARGTRLLAAEHDPGRSMARPSQTSPSQRLAITGRIAARMLLSGRRTLWDGHEPRGRPGRLDLTTDELIGGVEENATGDRFAVTPEALREAFRTGLFSPIGEERKSFRHSSFSAYLAASYLVRRRLSHGRLAELFLVEIPGANAARVPPPLRETAAWLVALDPEHTAWLVAADPESVIVHSALVRSNAMRELVVARLLDNAGDVELSQTRWQFSRWDVTHPRLAHQLMSALVADPAVFAENWPLRARFRVAVCLARDCAAPELTAPLLTVCRDDRCPVPERRLAVDAAFACDPEAAAHVLQPLLTSLEDDVYAVRVDPDDELRGTLLSRLWPQYIDISTVLSMLRPPRNPDLVGAYHLFLRNMVANCTDGQVGVVLRWLEIHGIDFLDSEISVAETFVDQVIDRVLRTPHASGLRPQIAAIMVGRLRRRQDIYFPAAFDDTDAKDPEAIETDRLALVEALIREILRFDRLPVHELWTLTRPLKRDLEGVRVWRVTGGQNPSDAPVRNRLLTAGDFGWVLDQGDRAVEADEGDVAQAYGFLASCLFRDEDVAAFELLYARQGNPAWPRLQWFYEGIPLDSDLAESMRMNAKAVKRGEGVVPPEYAAAQYEALAEARKGDADSFRRLMWNLQRNPGTGKGNVQHGYDLAKWPGAALFSADQLAALPECAIHYLGVEHDHRDTWLGTGRQDIRAWVGYQSLVLLHQADRIAEVSEQFWCRWTTAVVCSLPPEPDVRARQIQTDLLRRTARHAPLEFACDLERSVRAQLSRGEAPWNLRLVDPDWAEPLSSAMERLAGLVAAAVGYRETGDSLLRRASPCEEGGQPDRLVLSAGEAGERIALDTWTELLGALLSAGSEPADRLATEVLANLAGSSEPRSRDLAARAAEALLIADASGRWQRIRVLVAASEEFGRSLAERCSRGEAAEQMGSLLTEAELVELYHWLHSLTPKIEAAYRLGNHFEDQEQRLVEWREGIPNLLVRRRTPEALRALEDLTTAFPWRLRLKAALVDARNGYAAAGWEGVTLDELVRTLSLPEPEIKRVIENRHEYTYVFGDHNEFKNTGTAIGRVNHVSGTQPSEDESIRLEDLNRKAVATSRGVRRVLRPHGPETPWLHTPLSDVLEELNDPAPTVVRVRRAADALKPWIDWQPCSEGLSSPTAGRANAAFAAWNSGEGDRAECHLAIEELAATLGSARPESPRDDSTDVVAVLRRTAAVAQGMRTLVGELCAAFDAAGPVDDLPTGHLLTQRELFHAIEALEVCRGRLARLAVDAVLLARVTGALLIAGGWGTGKSYGLGTWVEARVEAGAPVAFVSGRELSGSEPWEDRLVGVAAPGSQGGPVRKLLAALQEYAEATGKNAALVVDALNDVTGLRGRESDAFGALAVLLKGFPSVMLVASTRLDRRLTATEAEQSPYGVHWANGVADPGRAWEVMRDVYKVPALVLPPDVAELRRPLMLTVLAWCLYRERDVTAPEAPVSVPTVGDLFERWLRILDGDYFEYLHGRPPDIEHPLVSRACALLGKRIGLLESLDYHEACDALRGEKELGDRAQLLEWLFQAGVLASDSRNRRIGFAVQRFAEHIWAGNLLQEPGHRKRLVCLLNEVDGPERVPGRAYRLLSALAGVVPHIHAEAELPRFLPRRLPSAAVLAILDSFQGRDAQLIHGPSLDFLREWTAAPETAPWVWYTVLVNSASRGHPAGAGFLHGELVGLGRDRLAARFIVPVLGLLEDHDGLNMLQRFISWASSATQGAPAGAAEVAKVLLWLAAVPSQPLRAMCVRIVARVWRDAPETAIEQLELFGASDDAYVAEASWLAAYGALLIGGEATSPARWEGIMARSERKPHRSVLQTISSIRSLLGRPGAEPSQALPVKLPRASLLPVSKRTAERCALYFESMVWTTDSHPERFGWMIRRSRILKPRRLEVKLRRRSGYRIDEWPAYAQQQKLLETVLEEWHGAAAPGSGEQRPWSTSSAPCVLDRRHAIDPTLPPEWSHSVEMSKSSQSWWCALLQDGDTSIALRELGPASFMTVCDPSGHSWHVLHSEYDLRCDEAEGKDDLPVLVTDRYALLRHESVSRAGAPIKRGNGQCAVRVEVAAALARTDAKDSAVAGLTGSHEPLRLSEPWPSQMYLAEYYQQLQCTEGPHHTAEATFPATARYEDTFLLRLQDGGRGKPATRAVPSRALAERLGLHWSGRRLDFRVSAGERPVIRDPSFTCPGPPALLLAAATADALTARGWTLVWRVRVTENGRFGQTTWTAVWGMNNEVLADQDRTGEWVGAWRVDRRSCWRRY